MEATTRFAPFIFALSILSSTTSVSASDYYSCLFTTKTVYTTVTVPEGYVASASVAEATTKLSANTGITSAGGHSSYNVVQQYSPPSSASYPGVIFPTYSPGNPNPNGPFYNPNNYIPEPIHWPGLPKKGATAAPPRPSGRPRPLGGYAAEKFQSPAWVKKGSNLKPELSQQDANGNSNWGEIDCPRLPTYLGSDKSGTVHPSTGGKLASKTSSGFSYSSGGPSKPGSNSFPSYTSSGHYDRTSSSSYSLTTPSFTSGSSGFSANGSSTPSIPSTSSYYSRNSSVFTNSSVSTSSSFSDTCVSNNNTVAACAAMPDTGVTRTYDFHVSYATIAPDGVTKNGLVVNGGFPGPLVEANWGDWISITVNNDLPDDAGEQGEGTAIHWHGFLQEATPWFDGVPSVQQCPISPSKSVTYTFRADHYGTSWYHSHYSGQYAGGALGPIVIHGPSHVCYDEDLGPIILSDWYHKDYFSLVNETMSGGLPLSNNNLINGKMNYPCANTTFACTENAGVSKFKFTPGKKYRLRLINTSAEAIQKFTLDGHNFTVMSNDFVAIKPYSTSVITLGVGQRSDVVVEAVGKAGDSFWMRSEMGNGLAGDGCSFSDGVSTEAVAAVYYDGADTDELPTTTSGLTAAERNFCQNDDLSLTQSLCAKPLASTPDEKEIDIIFNSNGTTFVWFINNSTFRANYNVNLLEHIINGNTTFEEEWNVYDTGSATSIRWVINNPIPLPHPLHLHGHDFNVLAAGTGSWDGTIVNAGNTQMRDVQIIPGGGYLVIQHDIDNPGVWPFHCHIAWHVSAGLYWNVLESAPLIQSTRKLPQAIKDTCSDWDAWSNHNVVAQIDSGL